MATNPGTVRFKEIATAPATPPVGYALFYVKTDNIVYVKDSSGTETPLGSASSITALTGDVTATGPGSVAAVVAFVGGKTAVEIAQSVDDTQDATSANTAGTIVKRDGSGNIFITQINGIVPEAHVSRHLPSGADPLPVDTPVQIGTTNFQGAAESFSRSDHVHDHGAQTSPTLHALATGSAHGFLSSSDKTKLDNATSLNTPSTLVLRDGSGDFSAGTITANLTGNVTGSSSNNVLRAGDTMTGALMMSVVALTDSGTINIDASLGNIFTVTLGGNRTLAAPTNPTNGQKIVLRVRQDGTGNRTLTFDSIYRSGIDIGTPILSTGINKTDYIGMIYHGPDDKWDIVAFSKGFG